MPEEEIKQPEITEAPQPETAPVPGEEIKQPEITEAPQLEKAPAPEVQPATEVAQPTVPAAGVNVKPPDMTLNVEPAVAMNITVQEFDKKIAESEANTAELKKQKAAYIYDTNVQLLIAQANQQQQPVPKGS